MENSVVTAVQRADGGNFLNKFAIRYGQYIRTNFISSISKEKKEAGADIKLVGRDPGPMPTGEIMNEIKY